MTKGCSSPREHSLPKRKKKPHGRRPAIDLIDGSQLCDLLKNLKIGVTTTMGEQVGIDRDWFGKI